MDEKLLIRKAAEARTFSYSPYSGYMVGAALLTSSGKIYQGCNIENAAFTPGICAERTAFAKAVSEGEMSFEAIAVVGGPKDAGPEYAYPCGVCRQVMMEFVDPRKFRVVVGRDETDYSVHALSELLPFGFGPDNLNNTPD